jgi:hypothetical protein
MFGCVQVHLPSTCLDECTAANRPNIHPLTCQPVPCRQCQVQPVGQGIGIKYSPIAVLVAVWAGQDVPVGCKGGGWGVGEGGGGGGEG